MERHSREVVIVNELGLHARSASMISKIAQTASSCVWIRKEGERVDATSIMDLLTLVCEKETTITIEVDNTNDIRILNELEQLVKSGFGEG